ncbi:MAG: nitroreductase [Rhizobiaceae bacterium]
MSGTLDTARNDAVLEFMRNRRSVPAKTMAGPGPDEAELREMIAIASRVPDHGKICPWRFIRYSPDACVRLGAEFEKRALELDPAMSQEMQAIERARFTRVPVVIGVASRTVDHPKVPQWEQRLSAGAVCMNLLIAANAHGYDAQWLTEWVAFDEKLHATLGYAAEEKVAGFIYIGTRTMPKTERDRPQIDSVLSVMEA